MAEVVAGLGNPGPEYETTRHNIGQQVLDLLADRLRRRWRRQGRDRLAHAVWRGTPLSLVKPWGFMNESGPAVAHLLRHLGAGAADLILVYDDLDLPLGTVRVRQRGSHGGHNGVRSVLETLGTEDVRRVKVGIGRPPGRGQEIVDHVLTGFSDEERPAVAAAIAEAADRVLGLVQGRG